MKKPEEIKKGLECCRNVWVDDHWKNCDSLCPYQAEQNYCKNVLHHDALALIQQLEAQVPRWNSADNPPINWRKNDKDKTLINYLVYSPNYGVDIGNWIETAKMWVIMGLHARVTHWMPLPQPPKEDAHG